MSRSRKKAPIGGITTAESEAWGKRRWHKRMRSMFRQRIHHEEDPMPVLANEAGNVWELEKDGKRWWGAAWPKGMRK